MADAILPQPVLASIEVSQVRVADRLRSLKVHRVEVLAADIDFQGLLQPILVRADGDGYQLVDGAHRLAALVQLGRVTIEAKVLPEGTAPAELAYAEIMANLDREDLTKLERAEHLAALKSAWEALTPSARHGGDRRSAAIRAVKEAQAEENDQSPILGLWSGVAEKVGLGRAAFFAAVQIATGLTDLSKGRIRGTWIEDHQSTLMALAREGAAVQPRILDLLLVEPVEAATIAEALALIAGKAPVKPQDKLYGTAVASWSRMSKPYREAFMDAHKAEIVALARKKGWF